MNKRLLKRHKRQVARAKDQVKLSEPDLRTPEQLRAARETSRAATDRHAGAHPRHFTSPAQGHAPAVTEGGVQPVDGSVSAAQDAGGVGRSKRYPEPGKEVL